MRNVYFVDNLFTFANKKNGTLGYLATYMNRSWGYVHTVADVAPSEVNNRSGLGRLLESPGDVSIQPYLAALTGLDQAHWL